MTYYQLCGGIAINGLENATAYHCALWDTDHSTIELKIVSEDGGGTSIHDFHKHRNEPLIKTETVETRTLDSFNLENIGFMKLDVEGAELEVLRGAEQTLKKSNYPKFIFEVWPDEWYRSKREQLFAYIRGTLGYVIQPISGYNNMFLATKTNYI